MSYSTSTPPVLVTQGGIDGSMPQTWVYKSADASATVDGSGYITNGGALGMKVGDLLLAYDTVNLIISSHRVVIVSSTYPGAVDLSDGTVVGSSSNSD